MGEQKANYSSASSFLPLLSTGVTQGQKPRLVGVTRLAAEECRRCCGMIRGVSR